MLGGGETHWSNQEKQLFSHSLIQQFAHVLKKIVFSYSFSRPSISYTCVMNPRVDTGADMKWGGKKSRYFYLRQIRKFKFNNHGPPFTFSVQNMRYQKNGGDSNPKINALQIG